MINTAPPASMTKLIFEIMCVTVVPWSRSCLHVQINRVRLPATLFSVSLYRFLIFFLFFCLFFFFFSSLFFNTISPFGLVFFILTADPAGHALGSIYFKLKSGVLFWKRDFKTLDLHTGQAYDQIKTISCQDMSFL